MLDGGNIVDSLGADLSEIMLTSFKAFDVDAIRYNAGVYEASRSELSSRMYAALHIYYLTQLRNLHKSCIALFEKNIFVLY
jgi:protein SEY1